MKPWLPITLTLEQCPDGLWNVKRGEHIIALFRTQDEALAAYGQWIGRKADA